MSFGDRPVAVSSALDLLGDKWSLLIIRDLVILGPRTYSDFRESPEGIATNILASRLKLLTSFGLIKRADPEGVARNNAYQLTTRVQRSARPSWNSDAGPRLTSVTSAPICGSPRSTPRTCVEPSSPPHYHSQPQLRDQILATPAIPLVYKRAAPALSDGALATQPFTPDWPDSNRPHAYQQSTHLSCIGERLQSPERFASVGWTSLRVGSGRFSPSYGEGVVLGQPSLATSAIRSSAIEATMDASSG